MEGSWTRTVGELGVDRERNFATFSLLFLYLRDHLGALVCWYSPFHAFSRFIASPRDLLELVVDGEIVADRVLHLISNDFLYYRE